ncbi:helix-turn-helix transcriptional regulator [Nocardioides okcheonensis]|uniref:helix-turn-helix transcriptional regulator n=1 Tax=Nocardioides okcheonensis TaxID=2894081 RepID=UPI001E2A97A7|nr:helix-turn-helix domain-containing protein [Nocardioides okcheonensis]UFN44650.1 helix-turn-helix domain-containing protein [Nocardioides okcheonensis]
MTRDEAPGGATDVVLAHPSRRAIVEAIREHRPGPRDPDAGGLTAGQLAERLGLHPTTVRFHTARLEQAGVLTSTTTKAFGVGAPRKVYALVRPAAPDRRADYLLRLLQLMTESFSAGATPQQAGEQWAVRHLDLVPSAPAASPGAWLGKVGPIVDVLQDWGYAPDLTTADHGRTCRLVLAECPFLDLARATPDVVCGIHEGLLRGALRALGEQEVEVVLEPFVGPALCRAAITTHHPFTGPPTPGQPEPRHHEESPHDA